MNLNRTDIYDSMNIPDEDVETALKVIRTMRAVCMDNGEFDTSGSVLMSYAHKKIVELCEACGAGEAYPDVDTPLEVTL